MESKKLNVVELFSGSGTVTKEFERNGHDVFSVAGSNFHWNEDGTPKTEKAKEHIKILKKCLALIATLKPDYYFIENPRGKMRYNKFMIDFLIRNNGMIKELTYSSYGHPTKKPTNIFTNASNYQPKVLDSFGRGAKNNCKILFDNMTKCQKQKIPDALAEEIRVFCENSFS